MGEYSDPIFEASPRAPFFQGLFTASPTRHQKTFLYSLARLASLRHISRPVLPKISAF